MIFTASVPPKSKPPITFRWKVSNGDIVKGQRSNRIIVLASPGNAGGLVTAKVAIGGTHPTCNCVVEASETVRISKDLKKDILELSLDKKVLSLPCAPGIDPRLHTCPDGLTVKVLTNVANRDPQRLRYKYTVSGGTIIGDGPKVVWDFSKALPGTYRINVQAYDKQIAVGKEVSRIVTVEECIDCGSDCFIPPANVISPQGAVKSGGIATFIVTDQGDSNITYDWKVTNGTIIGGQGTKSILVRVNTTRGEEVVTAEVTITGDDRCRNIHPQNASGALSIIPIPEYRH